MTNEKNYFVGEGCLVPGLRMVKLIQRFYRFITKGLTGIRLFVMDICLLMLVGFPMLLTAMYGVVLNEAGSNDDVWQIYCEYEKETWDEFTADPIRYYIQQTDKQWTWFEHGIEYMTSNNK